MAEAGLEAGLQALSLCVQDEPGEWGCGQQKVGWRMGPAHASQQHLPACRMRPVCCVMSAEILVEEQQLI